MGRLAAGQGGATIYTSSMAPGARLSLVVCAGAPALACSQDSTPPEILEARFADADTVVLRFSEPIGPVSGVDPSGHFRLGTSLVIDDGEGGELSVYYDLAHHFPDGVPGVGDAVGPWFRHGFTEVARIDRGEDPSELRLRLSYPLEDYVCEALAEAAALDIPAAIHLHYREGSFPRITDEAKNALEDLAPWWVAASFATTQPGAWPALDPRVPIPCP